MSRYDTMFARLDQERCGAFVPFVTLGDPNLEQSLALLRMLVASGADALEVGIPFSDPVADGPVIQAASQRALAQGVRPKDCWNLLAQIRKENADIPMGLLVYANLVVRDGMDLFYQRAADAGADSVLVADVPSAEAAPFAKSARAHGICPVLIGTPNANKDRLRQIAQLCDGYVYVVTRPGVTGVDQEVHLPPEHLLAVLKEVGAPPAMLGFGISSPKQVRAALKCGAAGAISGSAVVRHIEENLDAPGVMLHEIGDFVRKMKAATSLES